jgi:hypothetical protein
MFSPGALLLGRTAAVEAALRPQPHPTAAKRHSEALSARTCPSAGAAAADPVADEPPQAPQLPNLPSPPEIVRSLTDQLSSFTSNGDAPSLTGAHFEQRRPSNTVPT